MDEYVEGSVSAVISGSRLPERKQKRPGKRKKAASESDSQEKSVRFDCSSTEKDHVKYITTPFSSSTKKEKGKKKVLKEKIKKKKLTFDEENASSVKKILSKKQKLDSDEKKSSASGFANELPETAVAKEKFNNKSLKTHETLENLNESGTSVNFSDGFEDIPPDREHCTIFVGNLPLCYDHKKVVKLFSKFGQVENARVRCVPVASANVPKKTTAITKKFNPNRSSANAYVVFKSEESVDKAVAENGMVLNGHHLRIDHAVPKRRDHKKSIFVGGLPFDLEDDELWDAFKDCGEIEDVRIVRDNGTSMGKGFGYVNFKSIASVELALKLSGQEIKNRKINVQRCINKNKKKMNYQKLAPPKMKKMSSAKAGRTKLRKESSGNNFQGRTAEQKKTKKKNKKSRDALRRNKIKSVLGSTEKRVKKDSSKLSKLH